MALILKCLDAPLPVEPKKVQAKLAKKKDPKPKAKQCLRTTFKNMGVLVKDILKKEFPVELRT